MLPFRRKKDYLVVISGNAYCYYRDQQADLLMIFSSQTVMKTNIVTFCLIFFSALLNSKAFHISLMACSLEVVMAEKGLPCMSGFACV